MGNARIIVVPSYGERQSALATSYERSAIIADLDGDVHGSAAIDLAGRCNPLFVRESAKAQKCYSRSSDVRAVKDALFAAPLHASS